MRLASLVCLVGLAACNTTPPPKSGTDPQVVRSQIDSLDAQFNRWVVAGHSDSIASRYYAPDAILLNAGSPPIRGSDAIKAVYDGFYKMGNVRGRIQLTSLVAADSVATDVGHYDMEIRGKPDTTKLLVSDRGNYSTTFVRRNGEWRALYDINVSEVPVPTPAAASQSNSKK